jgi:hypothetical protein
VAFFASCANISKSLFGITYISASNVIRALQFLFIPSLNAAKVAAAFPTLRGMEITSAQFSRAIFAVLSVLPSLITIILPSNPVPRISLIVWPIFFSSLRHGIATMTPAYIFSL